MAENAKDFDGKNEPESFEDLAHALYESDLEVEAFNARVREERAEIKERRRKITGRIKSDRDMADFLPAYDMWAAVKAATDKGDPEEIERTKARVHTKMANLAQTFRDLNVGGQGDLFPIIEKPVHPTQKPVDVG